ncbi:DUF2877 domain-containing protein [Heyndrickxia sp. NPDC080065]|uniref:DUF2877 domain-containing protein n=1 Tax=Heyndrickxia sp. NPDC080065 TaxID=3390568 RepID=UPI003CFEA98B
MNTKTAYINDVGVNGLSISLEESNNGKRMEWTASLISTEIDKILEKNPQGCVHSVFTNSFNLVFGESLVHVGALENGLAPFGIGLNQNDVQKLIGQIRNKQSVSWDKLSRKLVFTEGIILSLNQVESKSHSFTKRRINQTNLMDNFHYVSNKFLESDWLPGLAQTAEEKKSIVNFLLSKLLLSSDFQLLNEMNHLVKLVQGDQTVNPASVFNYWIGRGLGLTPSGDDVLTGVCAILSSLYGTQGTFQEQLKRYLLVYGRKRTTHIAYEYLLYATENKFHSHLIQMCNVMDHPLGSEFLKSLEEMKQIGHTSGTDTLLGILLGIKALHIEKSL